MTLPNAKPVIYNVGEEVSTCREPIALNPNAIEFEPPTYADSNTVNPFMSDDGCQISCGDNLPPGEAMKLSNDASASPNTTADTTTMTEGQMAEAATAAAEAVPTEHAQEERTDSTPDAQQATEAVVERQELPLERITELVLDQVPFFFSRENWSSDPYLLSQMDSDQYVPIHVIASCSQFKLICKSHYSMMDALKKSDLVQVDKEKNRVRPNYKRCIVILREIPESTPTNEIEQLFTHKDCPKVVSCEFINNDSWYVTFDNDDDAQKAYRHLREVVRTFKDKPIAARIKTKPLTRQNCFAVLPRQPKTPQPQPPATTPQQQQVSNGNGAAAITTTAVTQPAPQAPYQANPRVFYPNVNAPYNYYNNVSAPVPSTTQAYFYPSPLMQWPGGGAGSYYDINSFMHFNGLSPKATYKPSSTARFQTPNSTCPSSARAVTRRWGNERSPSSSAPSGIRASIAPRTSTAPTNTVSSQNTQVNMGVGPLRTDNTFNSQNAYVGQQNGGSALPPNLATYSTFSPPETETDRNDVSSLVGAVGGGGAEFPSAYMGQASGFEMPPSGAGAAAAPMMPVSYPASLAGYGQVLFRNGYATADQRSNQQQRNNNNNNNNGRRRPRRDDDQNGPGMRSYQRGGYNGEGSHRPSFQDRRKPQFSLQSTAFPPLPGSDEPTVEHVVTEEPQETAQVTAWNVDTHKFSDITKGKPKPQEKVDTGAVAAISVATVTTATQSGEPSQPGAGGGGQQAAAVGAGKPKAAAVGGGELDGGADTGKGSLAVARTPSCPQPSSTAAPREQRMVRSNAAKKDGGRIGGNSAGGNKENRSSQQPPQQSVRPNRRDDPVSEEGWINKGKVPRNANNYHHGDDSSLKNGGSSNLRAAAKPLTNGDISPPPRVGMKENDHTKNEKPAPEKSYTDIKKDVDAATNASSASQGNSMSWAKMAKSGKDEMEKLSANIKEKEEQERIKKNRSAGRNPQLKPAQDTKPPFRRDPVKDKVVVGGSSSAEPKPGMDKSSSNSRPPKEFRPKSPRPQ